MDVFNFRHSEYSTIIMLIDNLGLFIEAYLFVSLTAHLFRTKKGLSSRKWMNVIAALLITLIYSGTSIGSGYNYKVWVVTMLLCTFIYSFLFFQGNIYTKIIICVLYTCILISLEMASIAVFSFFKSPDNTIKDHIFIMLFICRRLIFKIPLYFAVKFLIRNSISSVKKIPPSYLICMAGVCFTEVLWVLGTPRLIHNISANDFLPIIAGLIGVYVFLSMYYLFSVTNRNYEENLMYRIQSEEYRMYKQSRLQNDQLLNEVKQFRHDLSDHLFYMDSLLEEKHYDKLHKYLQQMHHHKFRIQDKDFCSNKSINIILKNKMALATSHKIPYDIKVSLPEKLNVTDMDLCTVISNLCANAITASRQASNPHIDIKIEELKAYLSIVITNHTDINVCEENPNLLTTKENKDHHGIGIKSVMSVMKKYNGIYKIESTDDYFRFNLLLQNADVAS